MLLPDDWHECERGNTLLVKNDDGEGKVIAWLDIADAPQDCEGYAALGD